MPFLTGRLYNKLGSEVFVETEVLLYAGSNCFCGSGSAEARYKLLEDGTFFGEIPYCPVVWANETSLEKCREVLQEVLEE